MSTVKGFIELKQSSYDIANGLLGVVIKSFENIGRNSLQRIKQDAPVDTGFMRDNVEIDKPTQTTVRIRAKADYSIYVDHGHQTRSGTTVQADPFFSKETDKLKAGEFKRIVDADVDTFVRSKTK